MFDMLQIYLIFALILYVLGIYTLASARNMVKLVIGIEILVAAANLNFLALAAFTAEPNILGPIDPPGILPTNQNHLRHSLHHCWWGSSSSSHEPHC